MRPWTWIIYLFTSKTKHTMRGNKFTRLLCLCVCEKLAKLDKRNSKIGKIHVKRMSISKQNKKTLLHSKSKQYMPWVSDCIYISTVFSQSSGIDSEKHSNMKSEHDIFRRGTRSECKITILWIAIITIRKWQYKNAEEKTFRRIFLFLYTVFSE